MKKILPVITVLFFGAMLFLTCFAERIHNAALPHVTFIRPEQKLFPFEYIDTNGETRTGSTTKTAIPESMVEKDIYIIFSVEKNGTERSFVQLAPISTGEWADGFVEVISGINFSDRIVEDSTGELFDGCEVVVEQ